MKRTTCDVTAELLHKALIKLLVWGTRHAVVQRIDEMFLDGFVNTFCWGEPNFEQLKGTYVTPPTTTTGPPAKADPVQ